MKRLLMLGGLAALVWTASAAPASAHGRSYRGDRGHHYGFRDYRDRDFYHGDRHGRRHRRGHRRGHWIGRHRRQSGFSSRFDSHRGRRVHRHHRGCRHR